MSNFIINNFCIISFSAFMLLRVEVGFTQSKSLNDHLKTCEQRTSLHLDTFYKVAVIAKKLSDNAPVIQQAHADYFIDYALYEMDQDTVGELVNKHIKLYTSQNVSWLIMARFRHLKLLIELKSQQFEKVMNDAQQLMLEAQQ